MAIRLLFLLLVSAGIVLGQPYPDQHYFFEKDSLVKKISTMSGMQIGKDGKSIVLSDGVTEGYTEFLPDSSKYPFNYGLPSWNGLVPNDNSSFRVLIRFYQNGWSPWLTAGYWKTTIWSSYGTVSFTGGKIYTDEIKLTSYFSKWQFRVEMLRTNTAQPSSSLHRLSLFVSDQQTTANVNITSIVNDKPAAIFIPTEHFYQYSLDPVIGGSICSPTSTSMVIRSFNKSVDPLQFAKDNLDPYFGIYGVWPRTVENAVRFGLKGSVTQYRTWSDAQKVLAAGGRIVMSVKSTSFYPNGHLIMLAGFDANGNPICHDPAKSNGYSYMWDKTVLSQAWFPRGGVSYTFYLDTDITAVENEYALHQPEQFNLSNYPNPFNPQTTIRLETPKSGYTTITIYDITGREIERLYDGIITPGIHSFLWDASRFSAGNYFVRVVNENYVKTIKTVLLK